VFHSQGEEIMQTGKFNVVTDVGWGSCGKGAIATALAHRHRPDILSTTNMANAGHVAVNVDGQSFTAKAVPSPSVLTRWYPEYHPHVFIGASAAFDLDQLMEEVQMCQLNYRLSVHPRAGVITEAHKAAEGSGDNSTKHIASTMQGCGTFLADKILRKADLKLARDYFELDGFMAKHLPRKLALDTPTQNALMHDAPAIMLQRLMKEHNYTILHEGSQGFSLDINHGSHYPECTSRGTTAQQNLADMGFNHMLMGDVYLVIRPYPIRVGNVVEDGKQIGYSGDCYDDHEEITWERVAQESGMPQDVADSLTKKELTTVTKRLRRVFTFSLQQLREAAAINGATKIALNFANYIDWQVFGVNEHDKLTPKVRQFIDMVEDECDLPVTFVGTGPQINQCVLVE
jgi:adenylosuccinate synthase